MKKFLDCAMDIGEQMLLCGAEVHRVEDCIERICHSFGAERVDVFIITSSMVLTLHDAEGNAYTQTRRINSVGTDFDKLDRLNQLSRKICSEKMSVDEIRKELHNIVNEKKYPLWVEYIMYALIAGAFTLFFGGTYIQALLSLLIGCAVRFMVLLSDRAVKNAIFSKFLCSFFISAMALAFVKLGFVERTDEIIIGNIMTLIPGIGFTNALRDLFTGDSLAGTLRLLEAILCAVAIAGGYFLLVFITGGIAI